MGSNSSFENGGAEAIKGFNFQKANLIFIAINNYLKDNFRIYIEAEDDIVVSYDQYKAYIQVKKQKHSVTSLTKKKKKNIKNPDGNRTTMFESSILEKNLKIGTDSDIYKIVIKDLIETDFKKFTEVRPGKIFTSNLTPTAPALINIKNTIQLQDQNKLNNFFITISPISEDLIEAVKYLIGCLSDKQISVDNNQGRAIIAELSLKIDEKAEVVVKSDSAYETKCIESKYLSSIFITSKQLSYFEDVLNRVGYPSIKNQKIIKARLKIELTHTALKEQIKKFISQIDNLEDCLEREIIDLVMEKFNSSDTDPYIISAIVIECICEIGEE